MSLSAVSLHGDGVWVFEVCESSKRKRHVLKLNTIYLSYSVNSQKVFFSVQINVEHNHFNINGED